MIARQLLCINNKYIYIYNFPYVICKENEKKTNISLQDDTAKVNVSIKSLFVIVRTDNNSQKSPRKMKVISAVVASLRNEEDEN